MFLTHPVINTIVDNNIINNMPKRIAIMIENITLKNPSTNLTNATVVGAK